MSKEVKRLDGERWEESFIEVFEDDNLKFHERDIRELIWSNPIDTITGESRRWNRSVETIIKMKGRYFSICWDEGLTESQESYYNNQPIEVFKKERQITEVYWETKE